MSVLEYSGVVGVLCLAQVGDGLGDVVEFGWWALFELL